jgi:hypothetical protein
VESVGESPGSKTRPPTVAEWRAVAQPADSTIVGTTGGWDSYTPTESSMSTQHPRRILLAQTDTHDTWLDLDTGAELVLPRPARTLRLAVDAYFNAYHLSGTWDGEAFASVPFYTKTLRTMVVFGVHEASRCLVLQAELQIQIPNSIRPVMLEALAAVSEDLHHLVRVEGAPARLFLTQTLWVHDWQPSPEVLQTNVEALLLTAETLHLLLATVMAGLIRPGSELRLFRSALTRFEQLPLVERDERDAA